MNKIDRDIRFLKVYALVMTIVCAGLFAVIFKIEASKKFEEIDVERINVVERDGKLRMVISNHARQHPGSMDGVTFEERKGQRPPGMMFFGENGNEIGGLVFDGTAGKGQGGSFTFDKFRGDQTIQIIHDEDEVGNYFAGLKMNDQNIPLNELIRRQEEISKLPSKEARESASGELRNQGLSANERLRIGRDRDKSSIIELKDARGRTRIELKVEARGLARLIFRDELGNVIQTLPKNSEPRVN